MSYTGYNNHKSMLCSFLQIGYWIISISIQYASNAISQILEGKNNRMKADIYKPIWAIDDNPSNALSNHLYL